MDYLQLLRSATSNIIIMQLRMFGLTCIITVSIFTFSLTKDVETRPGFQELLNHAFIRMMEEEVREVKTWYADIVAREQAAAWPLNL